MKLNQRTALAYHLGWDVNDVDWYQPTLYPNVKVAVCGEDYFCAVGPGKKPPLSDKNTRNPQYVWTERPDGILNPLGWRIFFMSCGTEVQ